MRFRLPLLVPFLALAVLAGCDATDPSASADAAPAEFRINGPSSVTVGDCDTFTISDPYGNPQSGYNWTVTSGGYLTASGTGSAFVLATSAPRYTVSARVNSPLGPLVSKTVRVAPNPDNTAEC